MIGKGLSGIVMLGLGFILLASTLPDMVTRTETVRKNPANQTGLACSTGGSTTCDITLSTEHAYPDSSRLKPTFPDKLADNSDSSDLLTIYKLLFLCARVRVKHLLFFFLSIMYKYNFRTYIKDTP